MRWISYLNSAETILQKFDGETPFHLYLKQFFKQHKKYGSRDRKLISQLCFGFFRMGNALPLEAPKQDELTVFSQKWLSALPEVNWTHTRLLIGYFLTAPIADEFLQQCFPAAADIVLHQSTGTAFNSSSNSQVSPNTLLRPRLNWLQNNCPWWNDSQIFPFSSHIDALSQPEEFFSAHLIQPDVHFRIRPGHKKTVLRKLEDANIPYRLIAPATLACSANAPLDQILKIDQEIVVQDASSQQVGDFLSNYTHHLPHTKPKVWDCCAASGGKSILLKDILGKIELTVSDIRSSILNNLKIRFRDAGIQGYRSFVADLSRKPSAGLIPFSERSVHCLLADVPCSGSGTWSRTPEKLQYFSEDEIHRYVVLQGEIIKNIVPFLHPEGLLIYITCSVFSEENEQQVNRIAEENQLICVGMKYLEGYTLQADTLFIAVFVRPEFQKKLLEPVRVI